MTALNLSRLCKPDQRIALIEASSQPARGLAYSTDNPAHLLNVRADRMSAFPDAPTDFTDWLGEQSGASLCAVETPAGTFVSRSAYGRYLADRLEARCQAEPERLHVLKARITQIGKTPDGFTLHDGHTAITARRVVLAMGNLPTRFHLPDGSEALDPWDAKSFEGLESESPVMIIGTGLTMVDTLISLRDGGFNGPIIALSRRGLIPLPHQHGGPLPDGKLVLSEDTALSTRVRALRRAADIHGWRETVDSLRPHTQALWQAMSADDKRRFLRHARPWWDIHRHRLAPPIAERLAEERATGGLRVLAGRITTSEDRTVTIRLRRGGSQTFTVQRVYDATGFGPLQTSADPLVRSLLDGGLARADALELGLDADSELTVLEPDGSRGGLYAIGPMVRGVLWECTAVPDIRVQAARLAATLTR